MILIERTPFQELSIFFGLIDSIKKKIMKILIGFTYKYADLCIANSKYIFDGFMMPWEQYFDAGFLIVNKNHKQFYQDIVSFYFTHQDNLVQLQNTFFNGTDQTPVNMLTHLHKIDLKLLPYEFNMNDMARKEILNEGLLFTKVGWVYQYNAIPNNKENKITNHLMKKTYEHFYGELNG